METLQLQRGITPTLFDGISWVDSWDIGIRIGTLEGSLQKAITLAALLSSCSLPCFHRGGTVTEIDLAYAGVSIVHC